MARCSGQQLSGERELGKDLQTEKKGGLGVGNLQIWNLAAIGKIAWHISTMQDSLWVQWVHGVYTKGGRWDLFNAPATASWVVKKLCKVKESLKDWMKAPSYSIAAVYKDLLGTQPRAPWETTTWNSATILKSRFITWLVFQNRLKTKQNFMTMGVADDDLCPICGTQTETRDHLFFTCEFSRKCIGAVKEWLGVNWNVQIMQDFYRRRRRPRPKRKIVDAVIGNLIYVIWQARNEAVWHKKVPTVRRVIASIKMDSKARFHFITINSSITI